MTSLNTLNSLNIEQNKIQHYPSIWGGTERIRQLEMLVYIQSQQLVEAQQNLVSMAEMFEEFLKKEKMEK
jgi:hypothetical protein